MANQTDPTKTYVLEETSITKSHTLAELAQQATARNKVAERPKQPGQMFWNISIGGQREVVSVLREQNDQRLRVTWHKRNARPEEFDVAPKQGQSLRFEVEEALRQRMKNQGLA